LKTFVGLSRKAHSQSNKAGDQGKCFEDAETSEISGHPANNQKLQKQRKAAENQKLYHHFALLLGLGLNIHISAHSFRQRLAQPAR
jgi:hypothetical protein